MEWRTGPAKRRIGLTKEAFGYGHLHPQFNSRDEKKKKHTARLEPEWNAPPIDSSDESPPPLSEAAGSPAQSDDGLPTPKRTGYSGFRIPHVTQRGQSDDEEAEGHIKPTKFTTKVRDTTRGAYGLGRKRSRETIENLEPEPEPESESVMFGTLSSSQLSQNKRIQTYKSKNLHDSGSSPTRKGSKKSPIAPKKVLNGFKVPATAATLAKLDEHSAATKKENWKAAPKLSSIRSPTRGTRRSSRHQRSDGAPVSEFKIQPAVPPRLDHKSDEKAGASFILPVGLPLKKETPNHATFKIPACLQGLTSDVELTTIATSSKDSQTDPSTTKTTYSSYHSLTAASSSTTSPLSSPPSTPLLTSFSQIIDLCSPLTSSLPAPATLCPVCQSPVPPHLLSDYTNTLARIDPSKPIHRLSVRQQALFCRTHSVATARTSWLERGYPTIDWAALPERLATSDYDAFIRALIADDASAPTYHRQRFTTSVGSGVHRTVAQSFIHTGEDGSATSGYYGSRGAGIIGEFVASKYWEELRDVAGRDKVVAAGGGVSGFVQRVLVPEVVCNLVGEDMGVSGNEARRTVEEGAEVGGWLCEEEDGVLEGFKKGDVGSNDREDLNVFDGEGVNGLEVE